MGAEDRTLGVEVGVDDVAVVGTKLGTTLFGVQLGAGEGLDSLSGYRTI